MQMEELQKWYKEGLYSRIEALDAAKRGLVSGKQEVYESVRRIAHALRGSGATYGYDDISEAAGAVEDAPNEDLVIKTEHLIDVLKGVTSDAEQKKIHILLVEDDIDTLRMLEHILSGPNRVVSIAGSLQEAARILKKEDISLIILDLVFPEADGRALLIDIRQDPKTATTPAIVLSAKKDPHVKIECFALGADDYFEKPFDPDTLALSVSAKLQRWAERSWESLRDNLTGLRNRSSFIESFQLMKSLSKRQKQSLCIGMIDLDHFKEVNDAYGHVIGDQVLKTLATLLSSTLRNSDIVARWGGEEFVVLFPNTDIVGALGALEKTLACLRIEEFTANDGQKFSVTFSAGVVGVSDSDTLETAVDRADKMLYLAKNEGRNRVLRED